MQGICWSALAGGGGVLRSEYELYTTFLRLAKRWFSSASVTRFRREEYSMSGGGTSIQQGGGKPSLVSDVFLFSSDQPRSIRQFEFGHQTLWTANIQQTKRCAYSVLSSVWGCLPPRTFTTGYEITARGETDGTLSLSLRLFQAERFVHWN